MIFADCVLQLEKAPKSVKIRKSDQIWSFFFDKSKEIGLFFDKESFGSGLIRFEVDFYSFFFRSRIS